MKIRNIETNIAAIILGFTLLFGVGLASNATAHRDNSGDQNQNPQDNSYPNWGGSFELRQTALNAGYRS